jgi:carboxylesterase
MPFTPNYEVAEDRRAYTLPAGRTGALILHGFMGSPKSSRPMAEFLQAQGISVHCPLLPGHGHLPHKIHGYGGQNWLAEAEEGLARLRSLADQIFLIGHSMGCVLGARLALQNPELRGFVMLAPLYDVPDSRLRLFALLRYMMPWFYPLKIRRLQRLVHERVLDFDPTLDLADPAVQAWLPQATRLPTAAIDEMRRLADAGRKLWPRLELPVVIFQGGHDSAVSPGNAERLMAALRLADKELVAMPQAGHELMRPFDPAHEEVWRRILAFIGQRAPALTPRPA